MSIEISTQVNLSSNSASIKNDTYNSVMIFKLPILKKEENILYNKISISHAQIPISYYIINENNNLFVLSTGSYTLTSGNYNANSFKTMFLSLLGSNFTMTLDNATGKYTLSNTSGYNILSSTTCYKILGLKKNTSYNVTSSLTFPYPCNFLGINRIKIKSSSLKTNNLDSNSNGHSDLLCCIPVNVGAYGLLTYTNLNSFKNIIVNSDITFVDITITDQDDYIINFNGIDIYLTLQVDTFIREQYLDNNLNSLINNNILV